MNASAAHDEDPDLPPVPRRRSISPAPEDFERSPGPLRLLWPVLFLALAEGLYLAVSAVGWQPFSGGGH